MQEQLTFWWEEPHASPLALPGFGKDLKTHAETSCLLTLQSLHAFALKQYLCGSGCVSKTSDNENTSPALRDGMAVPVASDPLSVKNPVRDPIPQLPQPPEEGTKIKSSV